MLDVERGPDVDAGGDQFLDVLPALGMAAFGRVGVGELVDDDQLGLALQRRVDVELLDGPAAIVDDPARQDLEALEQRAGLRAAVGLDQADDDVDALGLEAARAQQHRVGLADAGRGAEEDLQPAARVSRPARRQKRVRDRGVRRRVDSIRAIRDRHSATATLARSQRQIQHAER